VEYDKIKRVKAHLFYVSYSLKFEGTMRILNNFSYRLITSIVVVTLSLALIPHNLVVNAAESATNITGVVFYSRVKYGKYFFDRS
jgi:hypothetical protein